MLATDAVTMWRCVEQYHVVLQTIAPMAAKLDDQSMGHQRQYKRTERNLDDFLIVPVPAQSHDEADGADEADEADDDTVTPEQFQHILDIIIHVLNGGDLTPPIIYAEQSEAEQGEGQGSKGEQAEQGDESEQADEAGDDEGDDDELARLASDDEGMDFANEARRPSSPTQGGATGTHKNTGVRDDLDYKPETADEAGAADDDDDDDLTDEALQEAIDEAAAERDADPTLDGDVQSLHDAINNQTSDLLPYTAGVSTDVEAQAAADNLAQDIEQAFQENTVEKAPGWVEGQRRGFVNVLRYETRRPGDVEFFRAYTDTDAPGTNIAVSVLLDYSASMGGATKELAQAGYATKMACDDAGHPLHRHAVGHRRHGPVGRHRAGRDAAGHRGRRWHRPERGRGRPGQPALREGRPHRHHHDRRCVERPVRSAGLPRQLQGRRGGPLLHRAGLHVQRLGRRTGRADGAEPAPLRLRRGPRHRQPDGHPPLLGAGSHRLLLTPRLPAPGVLQERSGGFAVGPVTYQQGDNP